MNNVKCVKCLQKHLALCKSYAREVLDGHGEGGNPDHRDDIEGELTNAELHAALIDEGIQLRIRMLRRQLQKRRFMPVAADLEALAAMYRHCDSYDGHETDPQWEAIYEALQKSERTSDVLASASSKGCGCGKK